MSTQRIRNTVDIALFGGPYRYIAARTYDYLYRYKKPPGQHLSDLLSDKLEGKDEAEAGLCKDILRSLKETYQGINPEHVMNRNGNHSAACMWNCRRSYNAIRRNHSMKPKVFCLKQTDNNFLCSIQVPNSQTNLEHLTSLMAELLLSRLGSLSCTPRGRHHCPHH